MLRLGAQVAEVEALYACVLEAPDALSERRMLAELADAGTRLADLAATAAAGRGDELRVHSGLRPAARLRPVPVHADSRTRLQRRIASTRRTTEWIIQRASRRRD